MDLGVKMILTGVVGIVWMLLAVKLDNRPSWRASNWWMCCQIIPGIAGIILVIAGVLIALWG